MICGSSREDDCRKDIFLRKPESRFSLYNGSLRSRNLFLFFRVIRLLGNVEGVSAAMPPRRLANFNAMQLSRLPISLVAKWSVEYETWPPIGWHHHFVIGCSKDRLGLLSAPLHYGITWRVGIPIVFRTPVTVPLHYPNGRQLPAAMAVQGNREKVYWVWWAIRWWREVLEQYHAGWETAAAPRGVNGCCAPGWVSGWSTIERTVSWIYRWVSARKT